jgi:Uma2 family endonuclease
MTHTWSQALMPRQRAAERGRAMTLEAWGELGEGEDESGELADGFLTEEEVPDPVHELAVSWLIRLIGNWLQHRGGFVFGSDVKLAINSQRGRKPDVSVYLPGGALPPRRGLLRVPRTSSWRS